MEFTREQLEWVRTLIGSHKELQARLIIAHGETDADPDATDTMYREVAALEAACSAQLDMREFPADQPSEAELEMMYGRDIPF